MARHKHTGVRVLACVSALHTLFLQVLPGALWQDWDVANQQDAVAVLMR